MASIIEHFKLGIVFLSQLKSRTQVTHFKKNARGQLWRVRCRLEKDVVMFNRFNYFN